MIQVLLGHKKLETTALYAQVATAVLREVVSPLEGLRLLVGHGRGASAPWKSPISSVRTGRLAPGAAPGI